MSHRIVLGLVLTGLTAVGSMSGTAALAAARVPAPGNEPKPGDVVVVDGVGAVVPEPGWSVSGYFDGPGGPATITIVTMADGTVLINPDAGGTGVGKRGGTGQCADDYHDADSEPAWNDSMPWWFNSSSLPNYLGLNLTVSSLRDATQHIIHADNDCGRSDMVSADASYKGENSNNVNISANAICQSGDGTSQVGFGDFPPAYLAGTCNWNNMAGTRRVESDLRLNKDDFDWTNGADCSGSHSNDWYVEGIATHERGHTWNVVDFPNGHPNLTMGGAAGGCPEGPDEKSSLGLGDMRSLELRY